MRYADMLVVEPGEDGSSLMTGMVFVLGPAPLPIPPVLEPLGPILMTTLPRSPMLGPAPLPMPPTLEPPAGFTAMMVEPLPAEEPAAFWSRFSNVAPAEPEPAVDGGLICMICDG